MFVTELDTFIQKFQQLWNSGHTAHLDLDTCAGRAWVGLRVQLGHAPGPPHQQLHHPPFKHPRNPESPSRMRRRARRAANRQQKAEEVIEQVNSEAEPVVTEVKIAETADAEKALFEESRVGKTPERVEEEVIVVEEEVIVIEEVEEASDPRQNIKTEEIALQEVVDEVCPDVDYEAKPAEVVKSHYPRHCEDCQKYLRNNLDFRKHVVACMMARN